MGIRRPRIWRSALCATAVIFVVTAPANASADQFCETRVVHNYLRPLESLPSLKSEPARQRLPFSPGNLFFDTIGPGPLLVDSQEVGYALSYSPTTLHPTGKYLKWLVTAKLDRIDSTGRTLKRIGFKQVQGLRFRSNHDFSFRLSDEPALYRLEIVFRNGSGKRLGRYGRYLRVLEPRSDEHLTLSRQSFRVGETVAPWLENEGTDWLFFGLAYAIEEFDGSGWVPTSLGPKIFLAIGLYANPGEAASCWRFTVPPDAPAGRYRLRLSLDVYRTPSRREPPEKSFFTAEFEVVP